jgi:DNA-binding SARP family transcriptional activator
VESRAHLARPRLEPPPRSRETREIPEFPREICLGPRETDLARVSGGARGWRETVLVTISVVDHSNWPNLCEELEGIEVPVGFPDPREAYCAVFLLGPIRVFSAGQRVVGGWRRKSLEILAYLAVHPSGAVKDQILEALWPGGDPRQTQHWLWQSLSFLRSQLRVFPPQGIVQKDDQVYRLDPSVWVDAVSLTKAASGAHPSEAQLKFACDLYKGDFCEGRYFSWATGATEGLRSLCIDAARQLSVNLEKGGNVEGALLVLNQAIKLDPYDEGLCRRALALEAGRGRNDQVVRRFRKLRRLLLADLGVEPSPLTVSAFNGTEEAGDHYEPTSRSP